MLHKISQRVIRELRKLGYLEAGIQDVVPTDYDPASHEDPELARTLAASVHQRITFGERSGQRVRRIGSGFGVEGESPTLTGTRCASVNGFSLHTNTNVPAHRRDQLERLLRDTARGAASLERLEEGADGDLLYTSTHLWSDGTTGIKLSPLELLEKLAALVPLPRLHLVRYGGCLAPHSKLRAAIIPTLRQQGVEKPKGTLLICRPERWEGARQAPVRGAIKQGIERELAALHRAFHAVPTPAQMDDAEQHRTSQTPFGLDQPTGHHGNEHDANTEGGARRQGLDQTMHCSRSQVYWSRAWIWGDWVECFHNRPSIPNPSTESYSDW